MADEKTPTFPAGTYRAFADWQSVAMGATEDNTEQICIRMRVSEEDPHPDTVGMSILWFGNFANQKAIEITHAALRAMGWDGKSPIGEPDGNNGCLAGLGSSEVEMIVRHETYQGKTRAKVAFVNAFGAKYTGFKKALSGGALEKLNQRVARVMGTTMPGMRPAQAASTARPKPGSAHRGENRNYDPPAEPAPTNAPNSWENMTDAERAAAIDRGEGDGAPPSEDSDDDLPF